MGIKIPKFFWTSKKINGDFVVNESDNDKLVREKTQGNVKLSPGQLPSDVLPPTDFNSLLGVHPKTTTPWIPNSPFSTPGASSIAPITINPVPFERNVDSIYPYRSNFSPVDQANIDSYVEAAADAFDALNEFDSFLDDKMNGLNISYDPKQNPALDKSHHCKTCGTPSAGNVITNGDMKKKQTAKAAIEKNLANRGANVDTIGTQSLDQTIADHDQSLADMLIQVLEATLKQIIDWIIEFVDSILNPMTRLPDPIGSAIKSILDSMHGKGKSLGVDKPIPATPESTSTQNINTNITLNDIGSFLSNSDQGPNSDVTSLTTQCLTHMQTWGQSVVSRVTQSDQAAYYMMQQNNAAARQSLTGMIQMGAPIIPDGWITNKGTKYNTQTIEPYLNGKTDGSGPGTNLLQGAKSVLDVETKAYTDLTKKVMSEWWTSPEFLCCLIKNLYGVSNVSVSANTNGGVGRNFLTAVRALLNLGRQVMITDLWKKIENQLNLVKTLITQLLQKALSSYTSMLKNQIMDWSNKQLDLQKWVQEPAAAKCLPWQFLLTTLSDFISSLLKDWGRYFLGLINDYKITFVDTKKNAEDAQKVLRVTYMIDIIDKLLQFQFTWSFCIENPQNTDDITKFGSPTAANVNPNLYPPTDISGNMPTRIVQNQDKKSLPLLQNEQNSSTTIAKDPITGMSAVAPGSNLHYNSSNQTIPSVEDRLKKAFGQIMSNQGSVVPGMYNEVNMQLDPQLIADVKNKYNTPIMLNNLGTSVLLSNYFGFDQSTIDQILNDKGECNCTNVLTDAELKSILEDLSK